MNVDKCLDRGGRWDYENGNCIDHEDALTIDTYLNDGGYWNDAEYGREKQE